MQVTISDDFSSISDFYITIAFSLFYYQFIQGIGHCSYTVK